MRGRHWVMTLATGFFVAGLAAGGCGGSTSSGSPPDAGAHDSATADVTIDQLVGDAPAGDAPVDAGSDDVTDAGCPIDADLETIVIPDASLPDDASTGSCFACARASCSAQIMACNDDCACKTALVGLIGCATSGTSLQTCLGSALEPSSLNLVSCIAGDCVAACGISSLLPHDSGSDSADGASADGAEDAPPESGGD